MVLNLNVMISKRMAGELGSHSLRDKWEPQQSKVRGPRLKNAPTCYRAPRWPNPKKYPQARNSGTPKIPKKYPKQAFLVFWGVLFCIFGVFFGEILGVQNFGPEGIFSVCFVEISGRAISGLCSRSGRSQPSSENEAIKRGPLGERIPPRGEPMAP